MIFIANKYSRVYFKIIDRAKSRSITGYKETHHITPRSLGGSNSLDNLVDLTAKEHYIVHLLLPHIVTESIHKKKMWGALRCMSKLISSTHKRYIGSARFYEKAKQNTDFGLGNRGRKQSPEEIEKRASKLRGKVCADETKRKIGLANSGPSGQTPWNKGKSGYKIHKEETKLRLSQERKGVPKSEETKANMKIAQSLRTKDSYAQPGWKHSEDTVEKIREYARNRPRLTCPHCKLEGAVPGMKRYHFDNCKLFSESSKS